LDFPQSGAVGVSVDDGARRATDHSIKHTGDEGSVVGVGDDDHAAGGADHSNDDLGAQDRIAPVAIPEHEYLEEGHNLIVDFGIVCRARRVYRR
jgi:hypothetical protein